MFEESRFSRLFTTICFTPCLLLVLLTVVEAAERKPNIIFVLSDDHSYPYLGCYGSKDLKTPNLDRLAAEGALFHRMFTSAPQCVPSRAAYLTGRSAVACRMTRFSSPLPKDEITFPEILKRDAGYFVGVLGRSYHLDGSGKKAGETQKVFEEYGLKTFTQRFDYVDATGQGNIGKTMTEFFDKCPKEKPFCLWVNFSDPHHPWDSGKNPPAAATLTVPGFLPDLPGVRKDLSAYMGEIESADDEFQRVMDIVKTRAGLDNTLVIFAGDNGMAFPSGKGSLHDPGLHVPLIVWWRGVIKPGMNSNALISGEDIGPLCLQAAGLPVPERMSGIGFLPLLRGEAFTERTHIFGERGPHGSATFTEKTTANAVDYSRCVRSAGYKLIYNITPNLKYGPVDSGGNPSWKEMTAAFESDRLASEFKKLYFTSPRPVYELYDLNKDPHELQNRYGENEYDAITLELKLALQKKMILDYDYIPLPIEPSK